jgi:N-acetyl-alpha-D-muramate 1-phosphate uridylyltransferase
MKVMILAAGRGKRMMPLTKDTPKPLLKIGKYSLLEHHILNLKKADFRQIVINTSYLGEKIQKKIGNGKKYGVQIEYSDEKKEALETAGGIKKAQSLLTEKFIVINSDIWTDYNFKELKLDNNKQAKIILVPNPTFNKNGDFYHNNSLQKYTFAGIAIYHRCFFVNIPTGKIALAPYLKKGLKNNKINTELYKGSWYDIGTPERIKKLQKSFDNFYPNLQQQ